MIADPAFIEIVPHGRLWVILADHIKVAEYRNEAQAIEHIRKMAELLASDQVYKLPEDITDFMDEVTEARGKGLAK